MKPFFSIYMLAVIPFLAYGSALLLNHFIERGYKKSAGELEFPDSLSAKRTQHRLFWLAGGLIFPYALSLVTAPSWPLLIVYFFSMTVLVSICVMDFEQQLILDEFLIALVVLAILATSFLPAAILNRLIAGAGGFALFFAIAIVTRGGIGGGDIKLIGALGLLLGLDRLIFTVILGILAGGIVSLILVLTKKKGRKDAIAYGPYFAAAAILALCLL